MLISELMASELTQEFEMTRRLLARIPDDKFDWKAGPELHTIGWNASHLLEIAGWVPGILSESSFDIAPADGESYVSREVRQTAELLQKFDINSANAIASLNGVEDIVMDEPWSLKMGEQVLFTIKKR